MMEGVLDPETAKKWEWRPETAKVSNFEDNPHPFPCEDLNDMPGWGATPPKL